MGWRLERRRRVTFYQLRITYNIQRDVDSALFYLNV
jgi:hypothetical protein